MLQALNPLATQCNGPDTQRPWGERLVARVQQQQQQQAALLNSLLAVAPAAPASTAVQLPGGVPVLVAGGVPAGGLGAHLLAACGASSRGAAPTVLLPPSAPTGAALGLTLPQQQPQQDDQLPQQLQWLLASGAGIPANLSALQLGIDREC
jgi:hypothetical protein